MKKIKQLSIVALACLITASVATNSATYATVPGVNSLISVDSSEVQADNSGSISDVSVSADGRYVAFISGATNLVSGDTNAKEDVFVRDTINGTTVRASVSTGGTQSTGHSSYPRISHDGRYVVFQSFDTALATMSGSNNREIYRRDLVNNVTEHVSRTSTGYGCGTEDCKEPDISADGRFVAFVGSDILTGGSGTNDGQLIVRDMVTSTNKVISLTSSGTPSAYGGSQPSISCDGGVVAFQSYANDMRAGTGSSYRNIHYVVRAGNEYVVNTMSSPNGHSNKAAISCDGTHISFHSVASNLVASDTNAKEDIFVYSVVDKTTKLVSKSTGGTLGDNNCANSSSLSGNGLLVAYSCASSNLVSGDSNATYDIFITNVKTGTTEMLSVDSTLAEGNGQSYDPDISYDGKFVAYNTYATNLVPSDTNGYLDAVIGETGY